MRVIATVGALTTASLAVRLAVAFNGGLWRDEALFLGVVALPSWGAMLDFLRYHESHPPLFYAMMRSWLALFGKSDSAALSLPVLLGAMLVPATYAVGASIFRKRTGLIAAVFIAFAPRVTEYASMVRPYSLLALCVLFSMWTLVRATESGSARSWLAYAVSVLLMILAHNWAWLVVASQGSAILYLVFRRPHYRNVAQAFAIAVGAACLAFLPWLPAFLDQVRLAGHSPLVTEDLTGAVVLVLYAVFAALNATLMSAVEFPRWVGGAIAIVAVGIILWGLKSGNSRPVTTPGDASPRQPASLLFLATFVSVVVLAAVISPRTNMLIGACLSSLASLVMLLLAEQASCLIERSASDTARTRLAIVLAVGFALAGSFALRIHDLLTYPRANTREVVARLRAAGNTDDLVVMIPGWLSSSVNHYGPGTDRQVAFPDSGGSTRFDFDRLYERMSDPSALTRARRMIDEAALRGGRVWLLTDFDSPDSVKPEDRTYAETHRVAGAMARVRTVDIRNHLRGRFGPAITTIRTGGATPTWETVHAELYATPPPGSGARDR